MSRSHFRTFVLLMTCFRTLHASQPPSAQLEISQTPDGQTGAIALRLTSEQAAATFPLFVRHTGDADLKSVRLFAVLFSKNGSAMPMIPIQPESATAGVESNRVDVPGAGRQLLLQATVGNAIPSGKFTGGLYAERDGRVSKVCELSLHKSKVPEVRLAEANGNKVLLQQSSGSHRHILSLSSVNGYELKDLKVVGPQLRSTRGDIVQPKWFYHNTNTQVADVSLTVPAVGFALLEVETAPVALASYTGHIELHYDGNIQPFEVELVCQREPLSLEVLALNRVATQVSLLDPVPEAWLTVQENGGRELVMKPPVLIELKHVLVGEEAKQAAFPKIELVDASGSALSELRLKPNENRSLRLQFAQLSQPGEYSGTIRFGSTSSEHVDHAFTLVLRRPWWVAAIFIALGVGASAGIRFYRQTNRPMLLRLRQLYRLQEDTESLQGREDRLNDEEKQLLDDFQMRLTNFERRLRDLAIVDADAHLKIVDRQLALASAWIAARRQLDSARPATLAGPFRAKMTEIRVHLYDENASLKTIEDDLTELNQLPIRLEKAVVQELETQVNTFEAAIERASKQLDYEVYRQLKSKIANVRSMIAANSIDGARQGYSEARRNYFRRLVDCLRAALQASAPLGVSVADWEALRNRVTAQLVIAQDLAKAADDTDLSHLDEAIGAYNTAYKEYLDVLVRALGKTVQEDQKRLQKEAQADWEGFKSQIEQLNKTLNGGDVNGAAEQYAHVVQDYLAFRATLPNVGDRMDTQGVEAAPKIAELAPPSNLQTGAAAASKRLEDWRQAARTSSVEIDREIKKKDLWFSVVILIVAVLMGISLLWYPSPTWGGVASCITAVLWGLGLYEVSGKYLLPSELIAKFDR